MAAAGKRLSNTVSYKQQMVSYANEHGNRAAAKVSETPPMEKIMCLVTARRPTEEHKGTPYPHTNLIKWDGILLENLWGYEGHLVTQVCRTGLEGVRKETIGKSLQPPAMLRGNTVPGLGSPEV
ncbi:hypothetical protein E2C01_022801 [Portunus trituberculatus]|uniref:Uncharacterized protein n=1 Tax=Portunus trituberculatus TaxID=210409 RepID=A0A5B7E6C9_PORTR|nr:hypothetical protein [Portunus trituberculatus]